MERDRYQILENVAAIAALVHADDRLPEYIEREQESFCERLRWCVDAAKALTEREPADYEAADLDWYNVTDAVADGIYKDLLPDAAVSLALNPPTPPTEEEIAKTLADAAPDLVAAAKGIADLMDRDGRLVVAGNSDQMRALFAAIAKAEGRTL